MSETLYRKHRPQKFADLIGQEHVCTTLQNQLKQGSVGHAYLFTGPRGVGKTTSARLLAKAMNCLKRDSGNEPCNKCDACNEIMESRSIDVVEMDAASHTGVDNVRENIIENIRFAPSMRNFKIFIIDEVHMLSTSAFNALLKTLEEPPAHALFILATTEIHKVPQTIISRCQRFDFRRIQTNDLVKRLEKLIAFEGIKVEKSVLEEIARHSEGSQRDAESLLAQILALGEKEITMKLASLVLPISNYSELVSLLSSLSREDAKTAIEQVNRIMEEGVSIKHFIDDMIQYVRTMLLARLGNAEELLDDLPEDSRNKSLELVESFTPDDLTRLLDLLIEARSGSAYIVQLPLEMAVVKYCFSPDAHGGRGPDQSVGIAGDQGEEVKKKVESESICHPEPTEGSLQAVPELETVSPEEVKEVIVNAEIALPERDGEHVTFKTVEGKWEEVFKRVTEAHASLGFLIRSAKLVGVEENKVRLGFGFKFHADTMNDRKNREKLESVLQNVLGSRMEVLGEYVHADADEIVGELVEEFGGKAV